MIFFYEEPAYSDTSYGFVDHDDEAEAREVFKVLTSVVLLAVAPTADIERGNVLSLSRLVGSELAYGSKRDKYMTEIPLRVLRSRWTVDSEIPEFGKDRAYVERHLAVEDE